MEIQQELFSCHQSGSARKSDPETSKKAAHTIDAGSLEFSVLVALRAGGPHTTEQMAARLNMPLVSVSPRMAPLVRKGLVQDSGKRAVNASGRKAILWEAVTGS